MTTHDPISSFVSLSDLGFSPHFRCQQAALDEGLVPARVAAEHRGSYTLLSERGPLEGRLSGRLRHIETDRMALPAVGDWVGALVTDPPQATIQHVFSRASRFVRKASGRRAEGQVVAANIDIVAIVTSLNSDLNVRRLDRYLMAVREGGAEAVLVLSKCDLAEDPEAARAAVASRVGAVPLVLASAVDERGVEALRRLIEPGMTLALVGSSGVGKSSLVNRLMGKETQVVRAIREGDERGKHATTHRELFVLPSGGLLMDTPGMRELGVFGLSEDEDSPLDAFAAACRFSDCKHAGEPGCAVAQAIEDGDLDAPTVAHHEALRREGAKAKARSEARARSDKQKKERLQARALRKFYGR